MLLSKEQQQILSQYHPSSRSKCRMDPAQGHTDVSKLPYYRKRGHAASTYLLQSRRELLTLLPVHHAMRERTGPNGVLRQRRLPAIPRPPFTDAEIRDIKRRRNEIAADPDNANSHLQRSQLVNMWNANYDQEEQWEQYDQARPIMEGRREYSGLPDEIFESRDIVGEKRKRVASTGYGNPSRVRLLDGDDEVITEEAGNLEDGEIDEDDIQRNEELNRRLREQNAALRQTYKSGMSSFPPEAPPSHPESDTTEYSSDEGKPVDH